LKLHGTGVDAGGTARDGNLSNGSTRHEILGIGITLRSPAGDFLEGGQSPPSVLHFKGFKGDGFLEHRA
jgi:hypothetical protein